MRQRSIEGLGPLPRWLRHTLEHSRAALAAALLLTGCPGEGGDDEACAGSGDLTATAQPNRLDERPLEDGSEVPVFPPPQGGVFTELDVRIGGVTQDDLEMIRVRIEDEAGEQLANVQYQGAGLPLMCDEDDTLVVLNLPVGFDLSVMLPDLEGVQANVLLGIDTAQTTLDQTWSVTLRVTN